jgi:hypothetical protein
LQPASGLTIEAWINSTSTDGARVIVSKWNDDTGEFSYIFKDWDDDDTLSIELSESFHNDLASLQSNTALPLGTWVHVATTYDATAGTVRLYLNGVEDASLEVGPGRLIDASLTDLLIGAIGTIDQFFAGLIDEVSIYSRALTAEDIAAISTAGSAGKCRDSGAGQLVYANDFEDSADPLVEWSNPVTDTTPEGGRRFLGQFGSDTVELTLTDLPPHSSVTVSFDLYIINTWDGNFGPDLWEFSVTDGPTLLHTTFGATDAETPQAYPDNYPEGDHPQGAGAAEVNTLGYEFADTVYRLRFTFPHSDSSVQFKFSGIDLQDIADESWGLDNVRVSVTPAVTPCTLSLETALTDGTLALAFTIGTKEPATWNVWLTAQNEIVRLLSLPLGVLDPPVLVPFTLPFVPPLGAVGVLTTLTTPERGIICSEFATVETGPVSEGAAASVHELQDVLQPLVQ